MGKREDLSGRMFGRLKAIEIDWERTKRRTYWLCRCECGNKKSVRSDCLKRGQVKSCGCLKDEQDEKNLGRETHGMTGTRLYGIWLGMKARCYNPKKKRYDNYGGRGIEVCDEWQNDFEAFMLWAKDNGYKNNLTIDRINNDGNYSPENCRWSTNKKQANNRSSNINIEYRGKEYTLLQIAEKLNLNSKMLYERYRKGDRGKRLLRAPGEDIAIARGEKNNKAKITKEIAKEIKHSIKNGEKPIKIARNMDISKHIVYSINQGRTWTWV